MPKRKKKTDAWKKLVSGHSKGPKRVKFKRERKTKHSDPLKSAHLSSVIEFQLFDVSDTPKIVSFLVVNSILRRLSLSTGETMTYRRNQLPKWFKHFEKAFNDYGEVTLRSFIGRCYILPKKTIVDKVIIKIKPTEEDEKKHQTIKARVNALFKNSANHRPARRPSSNVEYM
tara:strand:- start:628 stop:1143 length:516 start_codon:yes stop_codon:yes gene_type:complete